jgi:tetratricopeptide (TPR) repeat protein
MAAAAQPSRPTIGPRTRRLVSDLLRNLDRPRRLRSNPVAQAYLAKRPLVSDETRRDSEEIRSAVMRALDDLPPRQRAIVERCDLAGELHADVIDALAVSEGHFYRERGAALDHLGRTLAAGPPVARGSAIYVAPDGTTVGLACATSLEQAGASADGIALLEDLVRSCEDPTRKRLLLARMSELYANAGYPAQALDRIADACAFSAQHGNERVDAIVEAARAYALYRGGDERAAQAIAERQLVVLRSQLLESPDAWTAEAMALVDDVIIDRLASNGRMDAARTAANEGMTLIFRVAGVRPVTRSRLALNRASSKLGAVSTIGEAADELERLLQEATALGLACEIGAIAGRLIDAYTIQGRATLAICLVQPLLATIRVASAPHVVADIYLELAVAHLEADDWRSALAAVQQMRSYALPQTYQFAASFLAEADAWLRARDARRALEAADAGVVLMTHLGRLRYVGSGMRLRALALAAAGNRAAAKASIFEAVDRLRGVSHPYIVARAERDAKRLSGRIGGAS